MASPITIFVNGHARQVPASISLGELARELELEPRHILVELNLHALQRAEWPEQRLHHGDRIEFLRVAAGG